MTMTSLNFLLVKLGGVGLDVTRGQEGLGLARDIERLLGGGVGERGAMIGPNGFVHFARNIASVLGETDVEAVQRDAVETLVALDALVGSLRLELERVSASRIVEIGGLKRVETGALGADVRLVERGDLTQRDRTRADLRRGNTKHHSATIDLDIGTSGSKRDSERTSINLLWLGVITSVGAVIDGGHSQWRRTDTAVHKGSRIRFVATSDTRERDVAGLQRTSNAKELAAHFARFEFRRNQKRLTILRKFRRIRRHAVVAGEVRRGRGQVLQANRRVALERPATKNCLVGSLGNCNVVVHAHVQLERLVGQLGPKVGSGEAAAPDLAWKQFALACDQVFAA